MSRSREALVVILSVLAGSCGASIEPAGSPSTVNDWTNRKAREKYQEVAQKTCAALAPEYFGLAVEVNTYYQHHPEDFHRFVEVYKSIYDALKSTAGCTNTKIFATFQLERMKGVGTAVGYSGRPQWEILDEFAGKLDLLVFTTYPEVEYPEPAAIPADYYAGLLREVPASLRGRRLAFAEMGWNSDNLISTTGSRNSFLSQALFIERFAVTTNAMKDAGAMEFAAWAFMHDFRSSGSFDPFRTIGLRNSEGGAKDVNDTVWNTWAAFKAFEAPAYRVGIGPIPRRFPGSTADDWLDMYRKVPSVGSLILAQTDWRDTPATAGEIPRLFTDINAARIYHQASPVYAINFFSLSSGEPILSFPEE